MTATDGQYASVAVDSTYNFDYSIFFSPTPNLPDVPQYSSYITEQHRGGYHVYKVNKPEMEGVIGPSIPTEVVPSSAQNKYSIKKGINKAIAKTQKGGGKFEPGIPTHVHSALTAPGKRFDAAHDPAFALKQQIFGWSHNKKLK